MLAYPTPNPSIKNISVDRYMYTNYYKRHFLKI